VLFILSFGLEAIGLAEARAFETVLMFLMFVAAVLLGVELWPPQAWERGIGRIGRAGLYHCNRIVRRLRADGYCRHVSAALTGRLPDNFVCFGLGLLYLAIGLSCLVRDFGTWVAGPGRSLPFALTLGAIGIAPLVHGVLTQSSNIHGGQR
jgi:hypothetical protein